VGVEIDDEVAVTLMLGPCGDNTTTTTTAGAGDVRAVETMREDGVLRRVGDVIQC
jgi:hypothetical protein